MCRGQSELPMGPTRLLAFPQGGGRAWSRWNGHQALSSTMALESGTLVTVPTLSLPRCMAYQLSFTFWASASSSNKKMVIAPRWGCCENKTRWYMCNSFVSIPGRSVYFGPCAKLEAELSCFHLLERTHSKTSLNNMYFTKYIWGKLEVGVDIAFHSQTRY